MKSEAKMQSFDKFYTFLQVRTKFSDLPRVQIENMRKSSLSPLIFKNLFQRDLYGDFSQNFLQNENENSFNDILDHLGKHEETILIEENNFSTKTADMRWLSLNSYYKVVQVERNESTDNAHKKELYAP